MTAAHHAIATALLLALLTACSDGPRHVPPVAKTNPAPTERYEITVELIDPPPDVQGISGTAHFGTGRGCLPYSDKINRITISAHYKRRFTLEPIGDNTYRGHIYLDWPVDEDYYGLGVCKWELGTFEILMPRAGYTQIATFRPADLQVPTPVGRLCRKERRMRPDEFCMFATEQSIGKMGDVSFKLSIQIKDEMQ